MDGQESEMRKSIKVGRCLLEHLDVWSDTLPREEEPSPATKAQCTGAFHPHAEKRLLWTHVLPYH